MSAYIDDAYVNESIVSAEHVGTKLFDVKQLERLKQNGFSVYGKLMELFHTWMPACCDWVQQAVAKQLQRDGMTKVMSPLLSSRW